MNLFELTFPGRKENCNLIACDQTRKVKSTTFVNIRCAIHSFLPTGGPVMNSKLSVSRYSLGRREARARLTDRRARPGCHRPVARPG
jgi:hypothetical protein